ncbi:hypothetical protein GOP47_0019145 [Adiantum capillus-veneris]|uniref:Uncharacterized protein n=1 Tax=Adiantum capillus-veneris TaxID=13818 RepID=A0A9D4ZBD0_ADICA|nr:hypothetical protein GOP47_0019145 [Adiantum capillus-veneris]
MASLTISAPAGTIACSAATLSGMKVSPAAARPSVKAAIVPVRAMAAQKSEAEKEQEIMKRRALVFGAFASAVVVASNMQNEAALAETDPRKKRNKCPTICVQQPTASCCYSY